MNQKIFQSLVIALLLFSLNAIAQNSPELADSKKSSKSTSGSSTFAVNGVSLDKAKFDQLLSERLSMGQADSKQLRESIAMELFNRELFVQEAKKKGINRLPSVRVKIDVLADRVLAEQYAYQYISEHPISEDAVKKEYEELLKRAGNQEVLIRQILLPSQEDAKGVLARIHAGEKFEEIAAKVSRDGSSRQQGGLIGWTPVGFLDPKIAEAIKSLSKGALAKEPVTTQFGWHILRLEDTRTYTKPSFENIRNQILSNLQKKSLDEHLTSLQSRTKKN